MVLRASVSKSWGVVPPSILEKARNWTRYADMTDARTY